MNFLILAAPIGAIAAAGVALAQPAGAPIRQTGIHPPVAHQPGADVTRQQVIEHVDRRFGMLDGNNDGQVTRDELRQQRAERRGRRADNVFERLDGNSDGNISRTEFDQAHARRGERVARRRGGGGGGGDRRMLGRMFGEQGFFTRDQMRERALAHFDRVDADRNGTITAAERQQVRQQRREQRREHMGNHGHDDG